MKPVTALLWLLALVGSGSTMAACPLPVEAGRTLTAEGLQLQWRAEPAVIRVGQPFALRVALCPAEARLLRVDATMPEHRHGMNYQPSVQALGDGLWRVEGLLWHMGGSWELRFDAEHQQRALVLRQSVQLK